jgi:hypothetical protein
MPIIPALRRLRQENYLASSKPAWTTAQDPASKINIDK